MNPRVKEVSPLDRYKLRILFTNGEVKVFDVGPYLDTGVFKELKDESLFKTAHPFLGSVSWDNGQDLCPDTLYLESTKE